MGAEGVKLIGDWGKAKEITGSMVEKFHAASRRAILQEGHFLRGEIVKKMREGVPPPLSPKTLAVRAFGGFRGSKTLIRTGDYRNSIVVKELDGGHGVFVGVLRTAKSKSGKSLANIAELMENGGTVVVPITAKSRKFYHAALAKAGIALPKTHGHGGGGFAVAIVKIPARPIFGPVFNEHGKPDAIRARFYSRMLHIFGDTGF